MIYVYIIPFNPSVPSNFDVEIVDTHVFQLLIFTDLIMVRYSSTLYIISCFSFENKMLLINHSYYQARIAYTIFNYYIKVRGPFVQTLCIEKDSYMDAI